MHQKSGDTEILHGTRTFSHKDIDFLQDTAKSAKNNTSDWKADWKNRVSWHCLIKLCCFSHQDCQQKAKHIASIQFSLQPDTKWHSFFASSLCYVPFPLPTNHPGREPLCTERAPELLFPRSKVSYAAVLTQSAQEPTEPLSQQGQGTTYLYSKQESFLLAKGKSTEQQKHLQQWCVSLDPSAKGEQIPAWICTAAPSSSPSSALPREGNSPWALGSVSETSC